MTVTTPHTTTPASASPARAAIGILGSGDVARALGAGLHALGHAVTMGSQHPDKLAAWAEAHPGVHVASFAEAAEAGEILILAVKGTAAEAVAEAAELARHAGKVVIDTTNPIADAAPEHGVLRYFTGPNESLHERLVAAVPAVRWVKAFNSVGHAQMVQPTVAGGPPTMFIAGDDADAKAVVAALCHALGWEAADMGPAVAARAIEPLCMLWCINGFARNEWTHAFRLLHAAA